MATTCPFPPVRVGSFRFCGLLDSAASSKYELHDMSISITRSGTDTEPRMGSFFQSFKLYRRPDGMGEHRSTLYAGLKKRRERVVERLRRRLDVTARQSIIRRSFRRTASACGGGALSVAVHPSCSPMKPAEMSQQKTAKRSWRCCRELHAEAGDRYCLCRISQ